MTNQKPAPGVRTLVHENIEMGNFIDAFAIRAQGGMIRMDLLVTLPEITQANTINVRVASRSYMTLDKLKSIYEHMGKLIEAHEKKTDGIKEAMEGENKPEQENA
jgi:hypothetical protein